MLDLLPNAVVHHIGKSLSRTGAAVWHSNEYIHD
jgi:hypothetical protein